MLQLVAAKLGQAADGKLNRVVGCSLVHLAHHLTSAYPHVKLNMPTVVRSKMMMVSLAMPSFST